MTPAPFHILPGDDPAPARGLWMRAEDGVRLRLAHWPGHGDAAGTVLLFPGRTEYLEKYCAVGAELAAQGYDVLGIDWRGQGMSDRVQTDPRPGHILDFADYQRDVIEVVIAAQELDLPQPWHLLSHSMGGCIGLGALLNGLPVQSAVFSAPMFDILHRGLPRFAVAAAAAVAIRLGRAGMPAINTGGRGTFVLDCAFNDNLLTGDGQHWGRLVAEAAAWPELTLGGASYGWVGAALTECARLARLHAPDIPALVALGGMERIVSSAAVRDRVADWPGARLLDVPGGQHEVMFETPKRRAAFMSAALDWFAAHG